MRRQYVSEEDRDTVVRLRKSGAGWLKIESVTGIPRRTAKRIFEEWQRDQVTEEIGAARRQVAAEVFNLHMRDLITLAHRLLTSLDTPQFIDRRDSPQVLESVFETDTRGHSHNESRFSVRKKEIHEIRRQNRILFESLKEHTRDKVDWSTLDCWLEARDEWTKGMDNLKSTATGLVYNILNQETNRPGPSNRINSDKRLVNEMVNGIAEVAYRILTADKPRPVEDYIQIRQGQNAWAVLFGRDVSETELIVESKELADKVAEICKWSLTNLSKGKESPTIRSVASSLFKMREARNELADKLDELRLTPLILRTRCEICPA